MLRLFSCCVVMFVGLGSALAQEVPSVAPCMQIKDFKVGDFACVNTKNRYENPIWHCGTIQQIKPEENRGTWYTIAEEGTGTSRQTFVMCGNGPVTKAHYLEYVESDKVRAEFGKAIAPYYRAIWRGMNGLDERFYFEGTNGQLALEEGPELQKQIAAVIALCKQYPQIRNYWDSHWTPFDLTHRYVDQCTIANRFTEMQNAFKRNLLHKGNTEEAKTKLEEMGRMYSEYSDHKIWDEYQMMAFQFDRWRAKQDKIINERFTAAGFKPIPFDYHIYDESLKTLVATTERSKTKFQWKQPRYRDKAAEAMLKAALAKHPLLAESEILAIGMIDNNWVAYDSKTWVARDSKFDYFRVEKGKNRYKAGEFLVKIEGIPDCQIRQFAVGQSRSGKSYGKVTLEESSQGGVFVKCPGDK